MYIAEWGKLHRICFCAQSKGVDIVPSSSLASTKQSNSKYWYILLVALEERRKTKQKTCATCNLESFASFFGYPYVAAICSSVCFQCLFLSFLNETTCTTLDAELVIGLYDSACDEVRKFQSCFRYKVVLLTVTWLVAVQVWHQLYFFLANYADWKPPGCYSRNVSLRIFLISMAKSIRLKCKSQYTPGQLIMPGWFIRTVKAWLQCTPTLLHRVKHFLVV